MDTTTPTTPTAPDSILVRVDRVYGRTTIYPVCERAALYAALAGTRTFTPEAVRVLKTLGVVLRVQQSAATI